jgi:hypothetical protein
MIPVEEEIIDAIIILTGLPPGIVRDKIEKGEYETVATQALQAFIKNYQSGAPTARGWNRKEDTPPVSDSVILERCLKEVEAEIELLIKSESYNQQELQELQQDAVNLRQRLNI